MAVTSGSIAKMFESFHSSIIVPGRPPERVAVCASGLSVRWAAERRPHDDRPEIEAHMSACTNVVTSAGGDREDAAVNGQSPIGYTENGITLIEGDLGFEWGERLDATSVPTIDAKVAPPAEPDGGWPAGTVLVRGRPVRPLRAKRPAPRLSERDRVQHAPRRRRRIGRAARAGSPRARRRTASSGRDGPSDSAEGGGDGEPPPDQAGVVRGRHPLASVTAGAPARPAAVATLVIARLTCRRAA